MNISLETLRKNYTLSNILNPEDDELFPYLIKYLSYTSLIKIHSKEKLEELNAKQKACHYKIITAPEKGKEKLDAWTEYLQFVVTLVPKEYHDQLIIFLALESFTKSMINEKDLYLYKDYISYFVTYTDLCRDGIEFFEFLYKNNICTNNYLFYDLLGVMYERNHDFTKANNVYLNGLGSGKVSDIEALKNRYNKFEERMKLRIERDLASTIVSSDEINSYLHNLIEESRNKLNSNYEIKFRSLSNDKNKNGFGYFNLNFKIQNSKLILIDNENQKFPNTTNFGNVPVYFDEQKNIKGNDLRKIINNNINSNEIDPEAYNYKGTQLVLLFNALSEFLANKDKKYCDSLITFNLEKQKEYEKMPYSWVNPLRYQAIQNELKFANNSSHKENNKKTLKNSIEEIEETRIGDKDLKNLQKELEFPNKKEEQKEKLELAINNFQKELDEKDSTFTLASNFENTFNYFNNIYQKKIQYQNKEKIKLDSNKKLFQTTQKEIIQIKKDKDGDIIMSTEKKAYPNKANANNDISVNTLNINTLNNKPSNNNIDNENENMKINIYLEPKNSSNNNENDSFMFKNFNFDKFGQQKQNETNINNLDASNQSPNKDNNFYSHSIFCPMELLNNNNESSFTPFSPSQLAQKYGINDKNKSKEQNNIQYNEKPKNIFNDSNSISLSRTSNKSDKFEIFKRKSNDYENDPSFDVNKYIMQFNNESEINNQLNLLSINNVIIPVKYQKDVIQGLNNRLIEIKEKEQQEKFIKEKEKFQSMFNMSDYFQPIPNKINNEVNKEIKNSTNKSNNTLSHKDSEISNNSKDMKFNVNNNKSNTNRFNSFYNNNPISGTSDTSPGNNKFNCLANHSNNEKINNNKSNNKFSSSLQPQINENAKKSSLSMEQFSSIFMDDSSNSNKNKHPIKSFMDDGNNYNNLVYSSKNNFNNEIAFQYKNSQADEKTSNTIFDNKKNFELNSKKNNPDSKKEDIIIKETENPEENELDNIDKLFQD